MPHGSLWNQHEYAENLGGNAKTAQNQCGHARWNQGGNLDIAVEMTLSSSGNSKLKVWKEVKLIEDAQMCEN